MGHGVALGAGYGPSNRCGGAWVSLPTPFSRRATPQPERRRWWNGLLYSRWQMLGLHDLRHLLTQGRWRRPAETLLWRSRPLDEFEAPRVAWWRQVAAVLVALEARYLPKLEKNWIHL